MAKSCQDDLKDGKLETVFSIMPTTTSAVQIRSLVLESDECIVTKYSYTKTLWNSALHLKS